MAYVFFALPPELQQVTLQFLPPDDLDRLFDLTSLSHKNSPHAYLIVRHQALAAKYYCKSLVFSNELRLETISYDQLDYLILHRIHLSPKDVTLAVFDFTNYSTSIAYIRSLITYLPELEKYTCDFRIRLILVENVPLDNLFIRQLFEPFGSHLDVSWFTIKFLPGFSTIKQPENSNFHFHNHIDNNIANEIAIENLQLQLFDSTNLVNHLVNSSGSFYCDHLTTLDISFNNLTDCDLRRLRFPATLHYLNLSNNQLCELSSSSFHHQSLTNLKKLDLSNNNLMQIDLHDSRSQLNGPYMLEAVNFSGNVLSDYSGMFRSLFFMNINEVDLSLNMITNVTKFPPSVTTIDLSGNYLRLSFGAMNDIFPQGLRKLSLGTSGPLLASGAQVAKMMIETSGLRELQELELCGSIYDSRITDFKDYL